MLDLIQILYNNVGHGGRLKNLAVSKYRNVVGLWLTAVWNESREKIEMLGAGR